MWLGRWAPLYSRKQIVEKRGTVITVCMSNFNLFLQSRLSESDSAPMGPGRPERYYFRGVCSTPGIVD